MFKKYFLTSLLLLSAAILYSGENALPKQVMTKDTLIKNFISWDKNLKTLDTFYTQETTFEGIVISKSEGHLFKNGQKLRLETLEEGKLTQYALTDKKIINIFDAKNNLITKMLWEDWENTQQNKSLFDFGNYAKILNEHKVLSFNEESEAFFLSSSWTKLKHRF